MKLGLCAVCATALATLLLTTAAATAQALPTCASGYAPTSLSGTSNAAAAPTAVTVKWKIGSTVKKELIEQDVNVWPASESRQDGRQMADGETSADSFTFNNSGGNGEVASGGEPGFVEPNTAYDIAVTAIYGKSSKYPDGCSIEAEGGSTVTTRHIFGINGGFCCSKKVEVKFVKNAETLVKDGIASDRVATNDDPETEAEETFGNTPALAYEQHFVNNDVIAGNVLDSDRLSAVTTSSWVTETMQQIETGAKYGDVLMEVGDEMWLKGQCGECAEPAKYAEMFVALSKEADKAKEAKRIPDDVKLLFNLTGDYYLGNDHWSNVTEKRGWLGDAIKAQPELTTRIEGFTFHPYDPEGETLAEEEEQYPYEYDYGLRGLKVDYEEAVELGVKHTNVFATEFGLCVTKEFDEEPCTEAGAKKTEAEETKEAKTDYDELLDNDEFPELKGLWWFPSYPGEDKYSFFKGWNGGEATGLLKLAKELSKKG
jgi:hypothetical protein